MAKKLDLEKVELALRQAAATAIHGPREARNGRFTAIEATKRPKTTVIEKVIPKKN